MTSKGSSATSLYAAVELGFVYLTFFFPEALLEPTGADPLPLREGPQSKRECENGCHQNETCASH